MLAPLKSPFAEGNGVRSWCNSRRASEHIKEIRNDLKRRPDGWLTAASDKAAAAVRRDYLSWRSRLRPAV